MANIQNVNYDTKRVYLHADTVSNGFNAIEAYFEINLLRALNNNGEQNRLHFLSLADKIGKGQDKHGNDTFTYVFATLERGWRFVAYGDESHILYLGVEIVSLDGYKDSGAFDFAELSVPVHVVSDYNLQEYVEVETGSSSLTQEEHDKLMALSTAEENINTFLDEDAGCV